MKENQRERNATEETEELISPKSKKMGKRKPALIFIAVLLILLAIGIPLCFVDFNALFSTLPKEREIQYYDEDYRENIWENEEYLGHMPLSVRIKVDGASSLVYYFEDMASAEETFKSLTDYGSGSDVLAEYFLAMLRGGRSKQNVDAYKALFTQECRTALPDLFPNRFPPQKVYDISLTLNSTSTDTATAVSSAEWAVSFNVVRNDGSVLNYTGARDGGEARFLLKRMPGGDYLIEEIRGIQYLN